MDRGFGGRDRYDDRSRDYDRGGGGGWGWTFGGASAPCPCPASSVWPQRAGPWPLFVARFLSGARSPCRREDPGGVFLPPPGYDSRIGSGRRAFGSGYRRDDDYRGGSDRYDDRYDRRDDRMDRWSGRDDYGRDDFRRDDRGSAGSTGGEGDTPRSGFPPPGTRSAPAGSRQVPPSGRS